MLTVWLVSGYPSLDPVTISGWNIMKNLPGKLFSMGILLAAGRTCFGGDLAPDGEGVFKPVEWTAASDEQFGAMGEQLPDGEGVFKPGEWAAVRNEQLGEMRGGFDSGAGLNVSFGIVRSVMINGDLVTKTSFHLPDVTKITAEQAQLASTAIGQMNIVQNGSGNSVAVATNSQFRAATVIQNSLNDQWIQTLTVINAGVNSLGLLNAINTQNVLKEALLGSIGTR